MISRVSDVRIELFILFDFFKKAVKEMYEYCHANDLREVWAYLWENWYRTGRWEIWVRSAHNEIPTVKTTMVMESQ